MKFRIFKKLFIHIIDSSMSRWIGGGDKLYLDSDDMPKCAPDVILAFKVKLKIQILIYSGDCALTPRLSFTAGET